MRKTILCTAALLGLTAVVLGAMATHSLKAVISSNALENFETGVRYQMYHALLLLFVGSTNYIEMKRKKTMYLLLLGGIILFSGSVYGLSTNALSGFDFRKIAFITPIGGALLIIAWGLLFRSFLRPKTEIK